MEDIACPTSIENTIRRHGKSWKRSDSTHFVEQTANTVATYMGVKSLPKTDTMYTNKFVGSVKLSDSEWSSTEARSKKYLPKPA